MQNLVQILAAHVFFTAPQKLGVEKISIMGWSDGGISGMIAAARYPELVDKLVIWGANAYITKTDMDAYEGMVFQ